LRTDKRAYLLRDEIVLDAALYNHTRERVYVYNQMESGLVNGLTLHIMDAGKRVHSFPWHDPPMPPQEIHDWKLLTGTYYGVRVSLRVSSFFDKPGVYKIKMTYMSMLWLNLLDGAFQRLRIIMRDDPEAVSPAVTITIKAPIKATNTWRLKRKYSLNIHSGRVGRTSAGRVMT
jgi:hypothetical protein